MSRAVIFDFDGVIVNSEPIHFQGLNRALAPEGIDVSWEQYQERYLAFDDKTCFSAVFRDWGRELSFSKRTELIERKAGIVHQLMEGGESLFPGVMELIPRLATTVPLAVNSGALRAEIELVLTGTGLRHHFTTIVSSEDVTRCKPDPEGYLLALQRLNELINPHPWLQPGDCWVIEDSVQGVESAIRAGMKCLAVTNSYPADVLSRATRIVSSLEGWQPFSD